MKAIITVLVATLAACTSTRRLAALSDPRLRTPDQRAGFVVQTSERWHERIDPNTVLQLHTGAGAWSAEVTARELHVDDRGAWVDRHLVPDVDQIEIAGLDAVTAALLARNRPDTSTLELVGDHWSLAAPPQDLSAWMQAFELAVARRTRGPDVVETGDARVAVYGDDAKLHTLRERHPTALGTWRVHWAEHGWLAPITGRDVTALLTGSGIDVRVGWRWAAVDAVTVTNLSGAKTLGAIFGWTAASVVLAPLLALDRSGNLDAVLATASPDGERAPGPPPTWAPELDASALAPPWFSSGARVRSIVRFTASLDSTVSLHDDLVASGAIANVRLADLYELGGGVRVDANRGATGWSRSTVGLFHVGLHVPLDAGFRFAIPLGFEIGAGGDVVRDLRLPWGLRYTTRSGHWFATLTPATPQDLRLRDAHGGRWSIVGGGEVGASF